MPQSNLTICTFYFMFSFTLHRVTVSSDFPHIFRCPGVNRRPYLRLSQPSNLQNAVPSQSATLAQFAHAVCIMMVTAHAIICCLSPSANVAQLLISLFSFYHLVFICSSSYYSFVFQSALLFFHCVCYCSLSSCIQFDTFITN